MSLSWRGGASRVRLICPLHIAPLLGREDDYRLRLRLRFAPGTNGGRSIEWIGIQEATASLETRDFATLALAADLKGETLTAEGSLRQLDPSRSYRLVIKFRPEARRGHLAGLSLEALPGAARKLRVDETPDTQRRKAIVVCWDLGHNCAGRAYVVADLLARDYDVEIVGALFPRFGTEVWEPLRTAQMKIRAFPSSSTADFLSKARKEAARARPDLVVVCKPRLPGILLGLLLKHRWGCPTLIDIDDHELAFVGNGAPIPLSAIPQEAADLDLPFAETWTRVSETLVPLFDGTLVSNIALQQRFGGTIVRHARDETQFVRDDAARDALRARYGYGPDDRVVLFLGTPRAHKGVVKLAEALEATGDTRLALCIIGATEKERDVTDLCRSKAARIDIFPPQPFHDLPALVGMADAVCLIQAPNAPVSHYQIPAKLSDALAAGVSIAVNRVPPFADLPDDVVTRVETDADLVAFLAEVAEGRSPGDPEARRAYYLGEHSYAANRQRLGAAIATAEARHRHWPSEASRLLADLVSRFDVKLPMTTPAWLQDEIAVPAVLRESPIDIAYFWKQNDTGIYGRRHDMLLRHLANHPRVGRIMQFDAPISGPFIGSRGDPERGVEDQTNLVVANVVGRFLRTRDDGKIARRVFVHRHERPNHRFLGVDLPPPEEYPAWVRLMLREAGMAGRALGFVAPVVADYPLLHDEVGFPLSIADLIDDQRQMASETMRDSYEAIYAETLKRVDLVITNCENQRQDFSSFRGDIHVVPNAGERLAPGRRARTGDLARLKGPVLGYVGNLRARIDVDLLEDMARRRPDWQIVLIGSAHGKPEALRLRGLPNVHFLGVRPYEEALDYMRMFDVAIMPHLDNALSRSMNPLKLYVYLSVGLPVVATPVANIGDVADRIALAADADGFIAAIEQVLASPPPKPMPLPRRLTWDQRVSAILRLIDKQLRK
ncbi:glycosyltransferase [Ancylobacter sonchi]|uniref:glycosyltransferase n=1 Tax=Ancylobacter sonchi TaxID=1937790 RepID=UPI001BD3F8D4|nr:glycosyltransferase [Ancylobacter sonchi]MBS7534933.1 glycosyltransferase [Ancylobacter sonchi]